MRNTSARNVMSAASAERLVLITVKLPTAMLRELTLLSRSDTDGNRSELIRRFIGEGIERELSRAA